MDIQSLSIRTNLIFAKFSGHIQDRGTYTLVQTPSNPGYHWGNYVIFDSSPKKGDYPSWTSIFRKEFTYYKEITHMVFTWDSSSDESTESFCPTHTSDYQEFIHNDFELEEGVTLSANELMYPSKYNNQIEIRKIMSDQEWNDVLHLQVLCSDAKFAHAGYVKFKRNQMMQYRAMSEQGMGHWFGAYLGKQLVGDLGIFFEKELGRYQNVGTHPNFRRQGVCQTLVYEAAQIALKEYGVSTLVMEADAHYHAAKIYESLGFTPKERTFALSWWTPHD